MFILKSQLLHKNSETVVMVREIVLYYNIFYLCKKKKIQFNLKENSLIYSWLGDLNQQNKKNMIALSEPSTGLIN